MKKNNTPQDKRLLKRKRAESRLKAYGIVSICLALIMLITLMTSIGLNGYSALQQAYVKLDVKVESLNVLDEDGFFSKKKDFSKKKVFFGARKKGDPKKSNK